LGRLETEGFDHGSPKFRAEAHLELGQVFLALGDEVEAERRYRLALRLAEEHCLSQFLFRSERALEMLGSKPVSSDDAPPGSQPCSAEVVEIRGELAVMREAVGALG
jgi:hypothetical protein